MAVIRENLLLIKVHRPTTAMLQRICHLEMERTLASESFRFHVQYYIPDEAHEVMAYDSWCPGLIPISTLSKDNFTMLFGQSNGLLYHRKRYGLTMNHELAFHALYRPRRHDRMPGIAPLEFTYQFLWVLEQDVAWQGNIYDALAQFDTRDEDLLCFKPRQVHVQDEGGAWWDLHDGAVEDFPATLRWMERSFTRNPWNMVRRLKCNKFVVRYSRRIMDGLIDSYLSRGHWAYDEVFASTLCSEGLIDFEHMNCSFCKRSFLNQCKVGDYSRDHPELFSDSYFSWTVDPPFDGAHWNYSIHNKVQFYHPMKF